MHEIAKYIQVHDALANIIKDLSTLLGNTFNVQSAKAEMFDPSF